MVDRRVGLAIGRSTGFCRGVHLRPVTPLSETERKSIMYTDFLPGTDAGLAAWALNFDVKITAAPITYGLTALQAGVYHALRLAYVAALDVALAPTTRSTSTIFAKNTAKKSMVSASRELAAIVQAFPGTTDQMRIDLGLNVRKVPPQPSPTPDQSPLIDLLGVSGYTADVRLHADGEAIGRAPNAAGATIWGYVGPNAPTQDSQWVPMGNHPKTKVQVTFTESTVPGMTIWLTARWYNSRMEYGPPAAPISANLPGFGSAASAEPVAAEDDGMKVAA
jgi:hypothetical protein